MTALRESLELVLTVRDLGSAGLVLPPVAVCSSLRINSSRLLSNTGDFWENTGMERRLLAGGGSSAFAPVISKSTESAFLAAPCADGWLSSAPTELVFCRGGFGFTRGLGFKLGLFCLITVGLLVSVPADGGAKVSPAVEVEGVLSQTVGPAEEEDTEDITEVLPVSAADLFSKEAEPGTLAYG